MRGPTVQLPTWGNAQGETGEERKEKGEGADFELLGLDSVSLNDLLPQWFSGLNIRVIGCPDQLDGHLQGYDHGPGILQSFQGDSNVQPGGKQCLPEVETAAESSVIHL